TGELQKANQAYELWRQSYPRDFTPVGDLADSYMRVGEWEKALRETEESNRIEANFAMTLSNLAWEELALNRPDQASRTLELARAHGLDSHFLRLAQYETAFLRGDPDTMQHQLGGAADRPADAHWLLAAQSDTEAYFGRLGQARELSRRAVEAANRA